MTIEKHGSKLYSGVKTDRTGGALEALTGVEAGSIFTQTDATQKYYWHDGTEWEGVFSPANISDLYAWYDASDSSTITKDGSDRVSQWNNKEGTTARNLVQATGTKQPLWVSADQNGNDVINFYDTVTAREMDTGTALSAISQPITIIAVAKIPANDSQQHFLWSAFSAAPTFEKGSVTNQFALVFTNAIIFTEAGYTGTWREITSLINGSSSSLRLNNVEKATGNGTGTFIPFTVGAHGGIKGSLSRAWRERVGEIIIYNKLLSSTELNEIYTYTSEKWGI